MKVIILTGPAGAGKNTVGHIIAQKREKCAVINVDDVRQMLVKPHKAPWKEEGKAQQKLGVRNACLLAKNFVKNGIDVIILDVVVDETAKIYRKILPETKIILLMPSFEEAHRRFAERPHSISEEELKIVYEWQEKLTVYDEKIDNSSLSAEETAEKINQLF